MTDENPTTSSTVADRLLEVDFFDRRYEKQRGYEICYNRRVVRVVVSSDEMIMTRLRDLGHTPEKVISVKVIREATADDKKRQEDDIRAIAAPVVQGAKKGRVHKRGNHRFMVTERGKKYLSELGEGQQKIVLTRMVNYGSLFTIDDIAAMKEPPLKTRSTERAIVAFYMSKWKMYRYITDSPTDEEVSGA